VYVITDSPALANGIDPNPIVIPSNGPLSALIAVLPLQVSSLSSLPPHPPPLTFLLLQLIAYELSILKGINPDVPRNLAKAVTVD
jgi:glutamine---fructose-6-phosphate transaminase (isomerizing)